MAKNASSVLKFVNPYNFVSLEERTEEKIVLEEKKHTGYLECRMFVKTPLCIPDVENVDYEAVGPEKKQHPHYSFFSLDGIHPAVMGSSVRGVIRSAYETVTGSCMSTMKENTRLTKRVESRKGLKAALLIRENGIWRLYSAKRYLLPVEQYRQYRACKSEYRLCRDDFSGERYLVSIDGKAELHNGTPVSFAEYASEDYGWCRKNGYPMWEGVVRQVRPDKTGNAYVFIGEPFGKTKHGESIFEKHQPIECDVDASMEDLEETIRFYRNKAINKNIGNKHSGYANYEQAKKSGVIPVWYDSEGSASGNQRLSQRKVRLSMASIGRIVYDTTLNELVGEQDRCKSRDQLCPACRIFGMIGEKSLGSRVRFTDAEIIYETELREVTLKELGSPRYSYTPFYAANGGIRGASYDSTDAGIRGRKFYWHQPEAASNMEVYATNEKTDRNATMELQMPGAIYSFRVYYDEISESELKTLMWVITLGENTEKSEFCHKIGHGKPIGLGSVKFVIDQKVERNLENGYSLCIEQRDEIEPFEGVTQEYVEKSLRLCIWPSTEELLKICTWSAVKDQEVRYPYVILSPRAEAVVREQQRQGKKLKDNVLAGHKWFSKNKDSNSPRCLASIMSKSQSLQVKTIEVDSSKDFEDDSVQAVWIAQYRIKPEQHRKLKLCPGQRNISCRQHCTEWANESNLRKMAGTYQAVLLPAKTKKELLDLAMELFEHVIVSKIGADGRNDDGWELKK